MTNVIGIDMIELQPVDTDTQLILAMYSWFVLLIDSSFIAEYLWKVTSLSLLILKCETLSYDSPIY